MRKGFILLLLALFLNLTLTACGNSPALLGKWEQTSATGVGGFGSKTGSVIEFLKDGTADLAVYSSQYSLKEGNRIELCLSSFCSLYSYKLEGDKLTITRNSDSQDYSYKRK
jgi:hypothetical protein